VLTVCRGVGSVVLDRKSDEEVLGRIVAKRSGLGILVLESLDNGLNLIPGVKCVNAKLSHDGIYDGLVVVKNLGRLLESDGVHLAVAVCLTLVVVSRDEVSDLCIGEAHHLAGAFDNVLVIDKIVEADNRLRLVVGSNVVGIAECEAGLLVSGKLLSDYVEYAVVVAVGLVLNSDVGVDLVESCDRGVEKSLVLSTHGVPEGDGYGGAVILTGKVKLFVTATTAKAGGEHCKDVAHHYNEKEERNE
jgi:hypothetical protein